MGEILLKAHGITYVSLRTAYTVTAILTLPCFRDKSQTRRLIRNTLRCTYFRLSGITKF